MDKKCKENSGIRIISVWKIRTFWGKSHKCTFWFNSETVKLDGGSESWYGSQASLATFRRCRLFFKVQSQFVFSASVCK